jgi:glycosyltransferase involved in cell wall biosynthesis
MGNMLSIIIPTFNEEKAIEKTLQSVKKLRNFEYEMIVSDSGSTDSTVEVAQRYADKVVRYDDLPRNAARGRNEGARVAKGNFLAFIDADVSVVDIDVFFVKALAAFANDPKLVGIVPRIRVEAAHRTRSDRVSYALVNLIMLLLNNVLHIGGGSGDLQMVRAEAFGKIRGYDENLYIGQDNDLFARLTKVGKTRLIGDLWVENPGRRARAVGWFRLWREWVMNWVSVKVRGRPWLSEWPPVR